MNMCKIEISWFSAPTNLYSDQTSENYIMSVSIRNLYCLGYFVYIIFGGRKFRNKNNLLMVMYYNSLWFHHN